MGILTNIREFFDQDCEQRKESAQTDFYLRLKEARELNVHFDVKKIKGFTSAEKKKFEKSLELAQSCINFPLFRTRVVNSRFTEANGLSSGEIYESFMSGRNKFYKDFDRDIEVYITMYNAPKKRTIGYTYPSTIKTWINRKYFRKFTYAQVAGNVIHEYCHNLGFSHHKKKSSSVPYRMGYIVRDLINELYG